MRNVNICGGTVRNVIVWSVTVRNVIIWGGISHIRRLPNQSSWELNIPLLRLSCW